MRKLAFCFLIKDRIDHEGIWYNFFKNIDKNKYNIYIHYKDNKYLQYFDQYKLKFNILTAWGHISLVHASNLLFKEAFNSDSDNFKFILLSGTCIPLKSFDYIYRKLTRDNYGYINYFSSPYPNANPLIGRINNDYISKASQWIILNREQVEKLAFIDINDINNEFKDVFAPDEIYYATYLKKYNLINQMKETYFSPTDATTFTLWPDMKYKFHDGSNTGTLKNYTSITIEELNYLLNSNALFGRKFLKECKIQSSTIDFDLYVIQRNMSV
jgi:hypothetical protein